MLQPAGSLIPLICISPASPEKPQPAPCTPFPDGEEEADNDGFRAKHLSPPPNISPRYPSPLLQSACLVPEGLGREQLDVLLKVSRERKAILGGQKAPDLRKELAIKNQQNKQLERRALFLSKVAEPPSPTATTIPKTPPESPAVARCLRQGWSPHAQCSRRCRGILAENYRTMTSLTRAGSSRLISAYPSASNALQAEQVVLR